MLAALAVLSTACAPLVPPSPSSDAAGGTPSSLAPRLTIGAVAGSTEQRIVAEIYAQALEEAGYSVVRLPDFPDAAELRAALGVGDVDVAPGQLGEQLRGAREASIGDADDAAGILANLLADDGLRLLPHSEAERAIGFAVLHETADEYDVETMSELAAVATQLTWGLPPGCETNAVCGGALREAYGIPLDELQIQPLTACDAAVGTALNDRIVGVAQVCSTQPEIELFNLMTLKDDKQTQPAENIAPIVRSEVLEAAGDQVAEVLNAVSAEMTTEELTSLGVLVAVEQQDIAEVASQWLEDNGF